MEACQNCGRVIGNLETPQVYHGHIVCAECRQILEPTIARRTPPVKATPPTRTREATNSLQRSSAVIACIGTVFLTAGIWMMTPMPNQDPPDPKNFGVASVFLIIGLVSVFAGLLAFAFSRIRQ